MWDYNKKVMDHFLHPRNVGEVDNPDGVGEVGNITCGDALKLTLKLDAQGRIEQAMFKTFGCASAIASSSVLTEIIKGMTLEEAAKVTNQDIVEVLGELPEEKMHCSVMGMEALQAAIADYRGEKPSEEASEDHEGRVVCKCFGVTDTKIRRLVVENKLHTAEEIIEEYYRMWLMPDKYLLDDYLALVKTIPTLPLLPQVMRDSPPIVRNLRTDEKYLAWERVHGLKIEVLEWVLNRRGVFPRVLVRRDDMPKVR